MLAQARADPEHTVAVYLDEVTIERQPTLANAYAQRGPAQALGRRSPRANTATRVIGAVAVLSGRVQYRRAGKITRSTLVGFYQALRAAYPQAQRIYAIQDNWPVHTHPDVLVALEAQESRWPWHRPQHWPAAPSAAAVKRWGSLRLPIQIVPLPTYASWCNPIEKLWRKLRQDVTHLHLWAGDLALLTAQFDRFLDQFADGSMALLRYIGLAPVPD